MLNTAKLRKKHKRRRIEKLAIIADKIGDDALGRSSEPDKLDAMLSGLDDGWDHIRRAVTQLAGERGEWAGYPLPIEHGQLVIEPRHPLAATLNGATLAEKSVPATVAGDESPVINHWLDRERQRDVYLYRDGGKIKAAAVPCSRFSKRGDLVISTLGASEAWSVEAEFTAMARLKTLVTKTAFRHYLLTGTFLETSHRSNVTYVFRKSRPTLAMVKLLDEDAMRFLCALCLHPIGYYQGTFAGSMVPTDDVIAHVILMRGDERKFWSKCNQHNCQDPEAGI